MRGGRLIGYCGKFAAVGNGSTGKISIGAAHRAWEMAGQTDGEDYAVARRPRRGPAML
jgi:hypothetical protein